MIYSGLDWSGTPGPGQGPHLVLAVVHIDEADLPVLDTQLAAAATRLGWPCDFVFKHVGADSSTHREFYHALLRIPFTAHIYIMDKVGWRTQYGGKGSRGVDCLHDGITTLLLSCPPTLIGDQTLYIDLPHKERKTIKEQRDVIRAALRGANRRTFRHIKARPDSRRDGGIIQIADMLSGEVAEHKGVGGLYLPGVRSKINLV